MPMQRLGRRVHAAVDRRRPVTPTALPAPSGASVEAEATLSGTRRTGAART
ncbi:hypothetical protein [Streptomyces virginiae]|uniref:hypothetical protein n=1 Tax=Streptomyces virginiae TaxID=1961 RepID=UPI00341A5BA8